MSVVNIFGGKNGKSQNVLMTALINASEAKDIKDNNAIEVINSIL